jgi:ppGpp synthetase/RelA/SpoT-type nucleotidyltranferase
VREADTLTVAMSASIPDGQAETRPIDAVDLEEHRRRALDKYQPLQGLYRDYAYALREILQAIISDHAIKVHSTDSRAKSLESFGKKAAQQSEEDPDQPKYPDPADDIQDLAAARVVTYFSEHGR